MALYPTCGSFTVERKRARAEADVTMTPQEQALLHDLVRVQGLSIATVARQLGRTVVQCRSALGVEASVCADAAEEVDPGTVPRPRGSRTEWSVQEDQLLAEAVAVHGAQWGLIQRLHFPGRTSRIVSYRWKHLSGVLQVARAEETLRGSAPAEIRILLEQYHTTGSGRQRSSSWTQQVAASLLTPAPTPSFPPTVAPSVASTAGTASTSATVRSPRSTSPSKTGGPCKEPRARPPPAVALVPDDAPPHPRPVTVLPSKMQYTVDEATTRAFDRPAYTGHGGVGGTSRLLQEEDVALTGDQVVDFVQRVVEMHADTPGDDDDGLYRAASAVDTLMDHLDMPRPAEQQEVVARELLQRNYDAFTEASQPSGPSDAHTALDRLRAFTEQADGPNSVPERGQKRAVPLTEPSGALVRRWEAETVPPSFDVAAQVRRQAARSTESDDPCAPSQCASFVARATSAAFYAAWANMEATGALHTPSWTNVWEPTRCVVRGLLPRCVLGALPCVYVGVEAEPSTAALVATAVTGQVCAMMQSLCPFRRD